MHSTSSLHALVVATVLVASKSLLGCAEPLSVGTSEDEEWGSTADGPTLADERADRAPIVASLDTSGDASRQKMLLALTFGRWHYAERVGAAGEVSSVSRCDGAMAYQIGDDVIYTYEERFEAANHAISRGEPVPFRVWNVARKGCTTIECGPTFGMVWQDGRGTVFSLDAEGRPEGAPIMTLSLGMDRHDRYVLSQRVGGALTSTILRRTNANLICVTPEAPSPT